MRGPAATNPAQVAAATPNSPSRPTGAAAKEEARPPPREHRPMPYATFDADEADGDEAAPTPRRRSTTRRARRGTALQRGSVLEQMREVWSGPNVAPALTTETFPMLLNGELQAPWRPEYFVAHCESEHNAESAHFFYEVESVRALAQRQQPRDALSTADGPRFTFGGAQPVDEWEPYLVTPHAERATVRSWAGAIVRHFVQTSAPMEVNVSDAMRTRTLKLAEQVDELGPSVFDESEREVVRLMHRDVFPRFAKKVLTTNLSPTFVKWRWRNGLATGVLTLAGVALCLGFFVPCWYLFLFFLPWLWVCHSILSAREQVCAIAATLGVSILNEFEEQLIECPIARRANRVTAVRLMLKVLALALLFTLVGFALTYVIEACTHESLYG